MSKPKVQLKRVPADAVPELVVAPGGVVPVVSLASALRARLFALIMLAFMGAALSYVAWAAYSAYVDSFVAPLTLSPDSDLVTGSMLKLDELANERAQVAADLEGIDAQLKASDEGLTRLRELRAKFQRAISWLTNTTSHKAQFGAADLSALEAQDRLSQNMIEEQRAITRKAEADVNAGLITRTEYAREAQRLVELEHSSIDTRRNLLQGQESLREIQVTERGLQTGSRAPLGPQLLASEEQLLRVDLEILRLESDARAKHALRLASLERIAKLDQLAEELKDRPIYRAIEHKLDLAFVPYTQLEGVEAGAEVYSCAWGLFGCDLVGTVGEILESEVNLADPWGAPARGRYAVLNLSDHRASQAKTLRVRAVRSGADQPLPLAASGAKN